MQDDLVWGGCKICNGQAICRHQLNIWYAHLWTQSIGASLWRINHKLWKVILLFWSFFPHHSRPEFCLSLYSTHTFSSLILSASTLGDYHLLRLDLPNLGATRCPMESFSLYQLRYLETSSPTKFGRRLWDLVAVILKCAHKVPWGPTLCVYPHASTWVFQSHRRTSFV